MFKSDFIQMINERKYKNGEGEKKRRSDHKRLERNTRIYR
jgi:hypothetical protein